MNMSIVPPKPENKERELVPQGNHVARLYRIINIGTIDTGFQNEDGSPKKQSKVRLYWELPNEMREFEYEGEKKTQPMSISREVTLSLYKSEKHTAVLRTITHALLGVTLKDEEAEVFDIEELLGKACMVEVSHETTKDGKVFAKAVGFGSIPKGMTVPDQVNDNRVDNVRTMSQEDIETLPEWLRDKMKSSDEYALRFLAPRSEQPAKVGNTDMDYPEGEIGPEGNPF